MNTKLTLILGAVVTIAGLAGVATSAVGAARDDAKRGEYLVRIGGCGDCHTPWKMGARGPEADETRHLSGHPADLVMPPAPKLPEGPWAGIMAASMTAYAGPWGVSYAPNLTPHKGTGLGGNSDAVFIDAMRTGRHLGKGRPILPPMPWQNLKAMKDADLKAIAAYLRTIPPIENKVPEPVPPAAQAAQAPAN